MIVATAAKCRFCGEIFDPALKKGGVGGKTGKLAKIASTQRNLNVCVLLLLACWVGLAVLAGAVGKNTDPAMILVRLIVVAVWFAALIGLAIYAIILGRQLYSTGMAILLGLLAFVPCLNLLVALFVSQRASRLLRDNGYEIGLLGAKTS